MPQKFLSIKNFEKYQHYKHRNPPWIKLHVEILDDPDFLRLPDASKWHYIGLILLSSRHENAIQDDTAYISNRLGLTTKLDLTPRFLKDHVLAPRKHHASKVHTNADSETEQSRDRVETEAQAPVIVDFDVFWKAYPRKENKQDAIKAWNKLKPDHTLNTLILERLEVHKRSDKWKEQSGKFIPHASTWLNGKRWEDELTSVQPAKPARTLTVIEPPKHDPKITKEEAAATLKRLGLTSIGSL